MYKIKLNFPQIAPDKILLIGTVKLHFDENNIAKAELSEKDKQELESTLWFTLEKEVNIITEVEIKEPIFKNNIPIEKEYKKEENSFIKKHHLKKNKHT
ncbi:MAG: hypothetical protein WC144_06120 [Sulfurimonas sp.]|jgi:hypothetical protein